MLENTKIIQKYWKILEQKALNRFLKKCWTNTEKQENMFHYVIHFALPIEPYVGCLDGTWSAKTFLMQKIEVFSHWHFEVTDVFEDFKIFEIFKF